jgi:predicted nucleic acid-binding protein
MGGDENAGLWLDSAAEGRLHSMVPDLVFAEVANALVAYIRAGVLEPEQARVRLRDLLALPLMVIPVRQLAEAAFDAALARGLSVYDACYAALAAASGAVLVTADAKLAAAVPRSALLPDAGPPG